MTRRLIAYLPICLALFANWSLAITPDQPPSVEAKRNQIESFELIWRTLRDNYWDETMAGLDWYAVHDRYAPEVKSAKTTEEARAAMNRMIANLPSSHLGIIPSSLYKKRGAPTTKSQSGGTAGTPGPLAVKSDLSEDDSGLTGIKVGLVQGRFVVTDVESGSGAAAAGVHTGWTIRTIGGESVGDPNSWADSGRKQKEIFFVQIVQDWLAGPPGSKVKLGFEAENKKLLEREVTRAEPPGALSTFGNLPPMRVLVEHRKLNESVGYIRLNIFLDPVKVMPEIEKAMNEFKDLPGVVFDLRNNPGGIAAMGMGIAGWFVSERDKRLGTMIGRNLKLNFNINPRLNSYQGRLAILVNGESASTAEILTQGLQDLGRARVFGTPTAAAALPSIVLDLPDGDRFQYPAANYLSVKGRVLEGNGLQPDEVVELTIPGLLAGRDEQLEKASEWSRGK